MKCLHSEGVVGWTAFVVSGYFLVLVERVSNIRMFGFKVACSRMGALFCGIHVI